MDPEWSFPWSSGQTSDAVGEAGTSNISATVTPFFRWVPGSNPSAPPSILRAVITSAAYGGGEDGGADQPPVVSADNGFGDGPAPWWVDYNAEIDALSVGSHLVQKDPQGQTLISLPPKTLSAAGGWANDWWNISTAVNYEATVDNYVVTLSRDGARGETQDPDGTKHGDTIYSYGDYINTEDTGLEERTDCLNWQTFHPNFIGNWNFPPGSNPGWAWTPDESDDTSDTGKVSMHYRNYYTLEGEPEGTDSPETRTVSYTVTDPLGEPATANYILTVHDPNELGPDTITRGIENLRMAPNAAYGRSTADGSPVTVYAEQSDSWSLGISSDVPWVPPNLGLNASASYTYSYNAGVQCVLPNVQAGYGTYLEEFDAYKYHTGIITQWDAGGYVGIQPYHVKEPDRPSGGYQAHTPAIPLPDGGVH